VKRTFTGKRTVAGGDGGNSPAEYGYLLLSTVKKYPQVYEEFLKLAQKEEEARQAQMGCERCRGKRVVNDDGS
jgi:hypothetical protein